jgi:hypothetical protein
MKIKQLNPEKRCFDYNYLRIPAPLTPPYPPQPLLIRMVKITFDFSENV